MMVIALVSVGKVAYCLDPKGLFFKAMSRKVKPESFHIECLKFAVAGLENIDNGFRCHHEGPADSLGDVEPHFAITCLQLKPQQLVRLRRHYPDAKILGLSEIDLSSAYAPIKVSPLMNQLRRELRDWP